MKIALINTIRPQDGSRDGITEYTYQIYERFRKNHTVDLVYVTDKSKRLDNIALLYANTLFKLKVQNLINKDYDIIHITNQELGFAAKILKKSRTKAKVITSIHDLMRMHINPYADLTQKMYNKLIAGSILNCFKYSDCIIFSASTVQKDANRMFSGMFKNSITTLLGPSEEFRITKISKKARRKDFIIGYVGALAPWKNPIFVLRTANMLKNDSSYKFRMYGNGPEEDTLNAYKSEHKLDNIEINGFPLQSKFLGMYDSFDLFLYPTTEEGSSLPVINAQCRGLPVVIYKGNKVDVEVTKYCFVARDEAEAASIIKRIREKGFDPKHRRTMLNYIRSFSWDRVTKETIAVYKKALAR